NIEGDPDRPNGIELFCDDFHASFGAPGNVFVQGPFPGAGGSGDISLLLPHTVVTSSNLELTLTFKDLGTYTMSIGVDSGPRTNFHVVVVPARSDTHSAGGVC